MEDKKALIYDCAKKLFSAKGFKDTNILEITKKAGMAVGTFYNYYPSKEKLSMDVFLEEQECFHSLDLEQVYREENGVDTVDFLYDSFLELMMLWQKQGKMRKDMDSKMIMMMFLLTLTRCYPSLRIYT